MLFDFGPVLFAAMLSVRATFAVAVVLTLITGVSRYRNGD